MYRKPSGKLSFSFNRMITNAVVSMAYDSARDIDLTPLQQDTLFVYQLCQREPKRLTEEAFFRTGIVGKSSSALQPHNQPSEVPPSLTPPSTDRASLSKQIHHALCKASILSPHASDPNVYTARITKNFSHQMPFIDVHRQRKLVSMLFFWEEELTRWRLLDQEEAEIEMVLKELAAEPAATAEGVAPEDRAGSGDSDWSGDAVEGLEGTTRRNKAAIIEELNLALARVQAKKRMHPSMRNKEEGREQRLPGYAERADTVAVPAGNNGRRGNSAVAAGLPVEGGVPASVRRGSTFSVDPVAMARELVMARRGTVA
ncbi:MAG: hypothetical protein MMC33_007663 [Icmadophila ericetorum]|nr:hypothetical protein [Icmadophila ericetorum]